jgi:hypothetical protein
MTCMHCRHEYKQPLVLNFTDFFVWDFFVCQWKK